MTKKSDEQMRRLLNKVHIAGILAELDPPREGIDTNGVKYLSLRGAVQCSLDDPAYTAYFQSFIKAKTQAGTDSKTYKAAKEWAKDAVPMTKDKKNATFVDMVGSLTSNNYVSADGKFNETFVNNIQFFNDFKEFCYDLDIEGYIKSINDEVDEEGNSTGRKKVYLVSKDIFNNALKFEKDRILIASKDIADNFDAAEYEVGRTVSISCSRSKLEEKPKAKKGGFGKQPVTTGKTKMIWEIVGGNEALNEDSDDALTSGQIKELLADNDARNTEKIGKGYLGSKNESNGTHKTGLKGKTKPQQEIEEIEEDEDDMPF